MAYDNASPSRPPASASNRVVPRLSTPPPASTPRPKSMATPGTRMPTRARHSMHATRNIAQPNHSGCWANQAVRLAKLSSTRVFLNAQALVVAAFQLATAQRVARAVAGEGGIDKAIGQMFVAPGGD